MCQTFHVFAVRTLDGTRLPVLILDEPEGPAISMDVAAYVRVLANRGDSFARMDAACSALGLLHQFYVRKFGASVVEAEKIPSIVASFLTARRRGTIGPNGGDETGLRWLPVKRETVARDRTFIAEYSEFCVQHRGMLPLGPTSTENPGGVGFNRSLSRLAFGRRGNTGDFLVHIADKRKPKSKFEVEINEGRVLPRATVRSKHFLSRDQVDEMIERTPSIMQRMLLILAFFGGPRLSEILHIWRCDVLPGRLRKAVFPDDVSSEVPLVLLAHPSQSTFVGDSDQTGLDRLQVLKTKYGLLPRHLIQPDPLWAGWKGIQFDDFGRLVAQVYWCDLAMAKRFYTLSVRLRTEVMSMVDAGVLRSHPYLIFNDTPGTTSFGRPMKLSNARKIFARAAIRIGVDADTFRDGSHGGRHFYKASLKRLGLDRQDIEKCMHHSSLSSQEAYGRELATLRANLATALAAPGTSGVVS